MVVAAHVWGSLWSNKHILFRSDNQAVVFVLNARTSHDPPMMHLLRSLLTAAVRFNFTFVAEYLPGKQNLIADALSRFHWQDFRHLAPGAHTHPINVPGQLLQELILPA